MHMCKHMFSSNYTQIEERIYVPQDLVHYGRLGNVYYNNKRM